MLPIALGMLKQEHTELMNNHYDDDNPPPDPNTGKPCEDCIRGRDLRREIETIEELPLVLRDTRTVMTRATALLAHIDAGDPYNLRSPDGGHNER